MSRVTKIAAVAILAVALFTAGGIGLFAKVQGEGAPPASAQAPDPGALLVADGASLDTTIASLQRRLHEIPDDWKGYASLGLAYVQQARVTQDPTYYPKAQGSLARSLALHPRDNEAALVGMAALAAARHDFSTALRFGERAKGVDPYDGSVYGVIGDAQLELGRYPSAFATFQTMVDTLPSLSSYARVSYARELQGDVPGAIASMEAAREVAGSPADVAWASYQIGDISFNSGRIDQAERAYRLGLSADPTYIPNLAGTAKVAWARGHVRRAIVGYTQVTERYPSPEYVIALGDLYATTGDREAAERQYDLARAEADLFRANGVNVDLELALFDADHGDPTSALTAAHDEWSRRRSIHVADAYAWALHANGRDADAARFAAKAMALGTRNALFAYHAGIIQMDLGNRIAARALLRRALAINPHFSILHAAEARNTVIRLERAS